MASRSTSSDPPAREPQASQRGFTYLGLLILVAIVSVATVAGIQLGAVVQRRDAEQELLHVGKQLAAALRSYRDSTPVGQPPSPRELEELLRDPRVPGIHRHLRRVPIDPITGEARWGVERTPDGGIVGVNSLSSAHPIKVGNFDPDFESFEGKEKYSQWVFGASLQAGDATARR